MTTFNTTDEQRVEIYSIAAILNTAGLASGFIAAAVRLAEQSEGAYDLLALWRDADDKAERDEILSDLQELLDEHAETPPGAQLKPYIHFNDLPPVIAKVTAFKRELRKKVDAWGGINQLARATGIPQPSLSRFFASASMPRRTTLYKIARAMNLPESEVMTDWVR